MDKFRLRMMVAALPLLLLTPSIVLAQSEMPPADMPPPQGAPMAPPQAGPGQPGQPGQAFQPAQLDQMLAPIALYPDQLLTQILMASTYPLDIVQAARWLQDPNNAALRGAALAAALQPLPWEPSVKALVPFPQVVTMLNEHLDWTQSLGAAFVNQQADVMAQVQVLRQQAFNAGKLQSTPQMVVERQGPAIVLAPANPEVVYVPVYDPAVVYGGWAYPAYPPYFWPAPVGFWGPGIGIGVGFGLGFSVGFGVVGPLWGWCNPVWGGGYVNINNVAYNRITVNNFHGGFAGNTWHHVGPVGGSFAHGTGYAGGRTGFRTPSGAYVHGSSFNNQGHAGYHGSTGGPSGASAYHGGPGYRGPNNQRGASNRSAAFNQHPPSGGQGSHTAYGNQARHTTSSGSSTPYGGNHTAHTAGVSHAATAHVQGGGGHPPAHAPSGGHGGEKEHH